MKCEIIKLGARYSRTRPQCEGHGGAGVYPVP